MKKRTYALTLILVSMFMSLVLLGGCTSGPSGTNSSEEAGSTAEAGDLQKADADTQAEATTEVPDPKEKFLGSWSMAAARSQGVTMSGNFGEMLEMSDTGMLNIKEDGTGEISLGEDPVGFTWEQKDENVISLKAEKTTDYTGDTIELTYEDGALLMEMKQDDQIATAIYTHDGLYEGVREIDMANAEAITSEDDLIGKWTMSGMKMAGITVSGDEESLAAMSGGEQTTVTFKEGGKVVAETGEGSWAIGNDGATYTSEGLTGQITCPVKKLGDEIVIDMTQVFGGSMEFITLFSRTR